MISGYIVIDTHGSMIDMSRGKTYKIYIIGLIGNIVRSLLPHQYNVDVIIFEIVYAI